MISTVSSDPEAVHMKDQHKEKLIALTFDDGPSRTTMVEILDLLEKYEARATFFIVGRKVGEETLPVLQRALAEGHELANHGFHHVHMPELSEEEILSEFEDCQKVVRDTLGVDMYYFRPPYGKVDDRMFRLIPAPFMLCGASGADGRKLVNDARFRAERFMSKVYEGCIGLLHCFEGNVETVKALETILPQLQAQGYRLVTLTQLYALSGCPQPAPAPGVLYPQPEPTRFGLSS